ncbi:52K [Polar bear adenovirus 1]|uniref:52K n=1 Tax=Polar bear adenovirus 1 TaxID=2250215 RepID=A0A2Z4QJM2_9ADEN|nr:52K [Polar bear adenovirus 1]AWY10557.1 52K [Polar bear adenovirus 1]AXI68652.1 52K [Polar bear adenovirus 1]
MHPVLRQMKPSSINLTEPVTHIAEEGEGLARIEGHEPDKHPRVCLKKDSSESYIPEKNVFRDHPGDEMEQMRDMKYRSGKEIQLDKMRVLTENDFEIDPSSRVSAARKHMEAADLVTAYEQTAKQEANFQKTFSNHIRVLISREEVNIGLMYLWDFIEAFVSNPSSKTLNAQLFLIVQHSRDDGIFRDALLSINAPESRWLLDLVNILQTIIVQERSLRTSEKVAAVNYSVITLGRYYARKIFKTPFVPLDKEVKIDTFYMRMVMKILCLCDDLGVYRNERLQRVISASRYLETGDSELMMGLRDALCETLESSGPFSKDFAYGLNETSEDEGD